MNQYRFIPSSTTILKPPAGKTENDIVTEFINLPTLPTNQEICIKKIIILNHGFRKTGPLLKYSTFTAINPTEYPEGKEEDAEYMPYDNVSPIIISDMDDVEYKVDQHHWFALTDIYDGVLLKQGMTRKKIFPQKIFIDNSCEWIRTLMNLVGIDIIINLEPLT